MARLKATNAETGIYSAEGWSRSVAGNEVVRDNTIAPYEGAWSWAVAGDGVAKNSWLAAAVTNGDWMIARYRVRMSAAPATNQTMYPSATAATTLLGALTLTTAGTLQSPTTNYLSGGTSPALVPGQWHKLEIAYRNYPESDLWVQAIYRLDGVEFARLLVRAANGPISRALFTIAAASYPVRINVDDVVVNDSTGAADNYWPDDVKALSVGATKPSRRSTGAVAQTSATGTNVTVNAPPTIVEGDTLVACISLSNAAVTVTPPAGWTVRVNQGPGAVTLVVATKPATASEPASYTFTLSAARAYVSVAYALADVHHTDPIIDLSAASSAAASGTLQAFPALDLHAGDTLLLEAAAFKHATVTATNPTSLTDGVVNSKEPTVGHTLVSGFYTRNDGGLTSADALVLSAITPAATATIAFRPIPPGALTGSASASTSASAALTARAALAGSSSAASSASAALTARLGLSGSASASLSGTGVLTALAGALVGSASASSSGSGVLRLGRALAGVASASSSGSGALTLTAAPVTVQLAGSATAVTSGAGGLWLGLPPRLPAGFEDAWRSQQPTPPLGVTRGVPIPTQRVEIRAGRFNRRYAYWPWRSFGAIINHVAPDYPWQAFWEASSAWIELPNIQQIELAKSRDEKGLAQATISLANIVSKAIPAGGHTFHRGYLSPLRGYVAPGRTQLVDEHGQPVTENEWFEKLNRNVQIRVWEGYGTQQVKTFVGWIDDVDTTSSPDVITLTARAAKQLSDERVFGWNKDPGIKDPVVFIDKDQADKITKVADQTGASSSYDSAHVSSNVVDDDSTSAWWSQDHLTPDVTEYVEISLPEGRYSDFWLGLDFNDHEIYVSVRPALMADGGNPKRNGVELTPGEWYDGSGGDLVPGTYGGVPYVSHQLHCDDTTQVRSLNGEFVMGLGSTLRISIRELSNVSGRFAAGVRTLLGRRRTLSEEAKTDKWVRVLDMADVVKVVLIWAGFKEWDVESTGIRLPKRLVVNRGMTYMDVIDTVKDAIGFDFFVADPTLDDDSLGVPTFRRSRVVTNDPPVVTVRDTDLLTAVDVKATDEPLAYIIRARGRESSADGVTLGGDASKRLQYTFRPPWSGTPMAGIIRHVVHTNTLFKSADDVRFGAYFIALQEALGSTAAGIEIPGYPGIDIDDHVELLDVGTGVSTRLSASQLRSTFTAGEQAKWTTTVNGPLVDIPDVQDMVAIINADSRSST